MAQAPLPIRSGRVAQNSAANQVGKGDSSSATYQVRKVACPRSSADGATPALKYGSRSATYQVRKGGLPPLKRRRRDTSFEIWLKVRYLSGQEGWLAPARPPTASFEIWLKIRYLAG